MGGDADLVEQALVAQAGQAVPQGRAMRAEQLGGRMDDDGVGAFQAQATQAVAGLGLDIVRAPVRTRGRQGHPERDGTGNQVAENGFGPAIDARGVEDRQARAVGDRKNVTGLGFRRTPARRRRHAIEPELGGREAKL